MKKQFILFAFLFGCLIYVNAQQPQIARVSAANVTTIYTDFKQAIYAAQDDDIIYVPGAAFSSDSITINKRIHIIGTGHYPDSTLASGLSILNMDVFFMQGSSGASVQGVKTKNILTYDVNNAGITISKCYLNGQITYGGSQVTNCNVFISETVAQAINGQNGVKFTVEKSIFLGNYVSDPSGGYTLLYIQNSQFKHCLFPSPGTNINITSTIISNSIFNTNVGINGDLTTCSFNYNLFTKASAVTVVNTNTEIGNVAEGSLDNTFKNVPADGFNYAYDYRLKDNSVAKFIPGGAGIYSASIPYNPNPYNPHISFKEVKPTTNAQGQLEVKVKVKAN